MTTCMFGSVLAMVLRVEALFVTVALVDWAVCV